VRIGLDQSTLFLQLLQSTFGPLSDEGSIEYVLDIATAIFSLVLFAVTLFAWTRRSRQPTLLMVSLGFLVFFVKQVVEALPLIALHGELFGSVMDFLTLIIFFVALVVRPSRRVLSTNSRNKEVDVQES
jgi:hypothetical protein